MSRPDCHSGATLTAARGGKEYDAPVSMGLNGFAARVHETAIEKGFWMPEEEYKGIPYADEFITGVLMTKLALVHSEVTEVLEAVRKGQGGDAELEEIADVIIRILDYYEKRRRMGAFPDGQTLESVLQFKASKNDKRPRLHGNAF